MTTARKARLDPADHHAAADPAEALLAELTDALAQLRRGRFDVRLPRREGAAGALADQFNDMAAVAQRHNRDLLRIGRSVGREGRMGDRLDEESYDGSWGDGARAVNALIDDLAAPTAEIARVIEAVAHPALTADAAPDPEEVAVVPLRDGGQVVELVGERARRTLPAGQPHVEPAPPQLGQGVGELGEHRFRRIGGSDPIRRIDVPRLPGRRHGSRPPLSGAWPDRRRPSPVTDLPA